MADQLVRTRLHHLDIPLLAPFRTATGVVRKRSVVLVAVGDGVTGWGEAAPYPGQDETIEGLMEGARASSVSPALAAGLDEALHDHAARRNGVPLHPVTAAEVPVSVALGIDDAVERASALAALGVARFKVKIAPGAIDHLAAIREAHPDALLGVDGNRSFESMDRHGLGILVDTDVAYAEELFTDWVSGAAEAFVDLSGIPLFADESVRSIADIHHLVALPAVGGITVKPGRLGWSGSLEAVATAREAGRRWRASGLLETGIGRAYTDLLAADPSAAPSDVAPASAFLAGDVAGDRAGFGVVRVPTGAGIGTTPAPDALERYTVEVIEVDLPVSGWEGPIPG
jgi:O-succinylbenzoate synthase